MLSPVTAATVDSRHAPLAAFLSPRCRMPSAHWAATSAMASSRARRHNAGWSIRQVAAAGFCSVTVRACPPVVHGYFPWRGELRGSRSAGLFKIGHAAETDELRGHAVTQSLTFVVRKAA
jgi:hypothetical protein